MSKNKLTEQQIQTRAIMRIIALIYICSFFLPTMDYYGPTYGFALVLSPFVFLTLVPNVIVIITFFGYRQFKYSLKIVLAVIVVLTSCIWWLVDINTHYPLIDSLLIGYWVWLISCFLIMLVPLFNSENKK